MTANKQQLNSASKLLKGDPKRNEDGIRQDIVRLLDSYEIDSRLSWRTPAGLADIYLPRRRVLIETKKKRSADNPHQPQSGYGGETPFQQMERYLRSTMEDELYRMPLEYQPNLSWTGIVTDGRVWHAWKYDHASGAKARQVLSAFKPNSEQELIYKIVPLLDVEEVGKPWVPSNPVQIFEPHLSKLYDIYAGLEDTNLRHTNTKVALWLEMLRSASMEPENDAARHRLFVSHTFLVVLARGVIHTLGAPNTQPDYKSILDSGFVAWVMSTERARSWSSDLLNRIHGFEWRNQPGDVLRPLYEHFVGERDRKIFGEFYTPDWLAELLVKQVLDEDWCRRSIADTLIAEQKRTELKGVGVLDPACGSGTFLYFAARRLLASDALVDHPAPKKAAVIARLVNGIDVHPVAAEISRATLLRALPAEPPDGLSSLRVYEGDSLLVSSFGENSMFHPKHDKIHITTPKNHGAGLPRTFFEHPTFTELLRRFVKAAEQDTTLPEDILASVPSYDHEALSECYDAFVKIIKLEGNSVWTWYIANMTGVLQLSERKVNRIVANPPWVSMAGIQSSSRKRALKDFAKERLNIWTGKKHASHFDIAQLFVKRSRLLYLTNPKSDPAAWIVKKSALKAGSWERFRDWHNEFLVQSLDLEKVQPFGGGDARRCCVLFDCRGSDIAPGSRIAATLMGKRPEHKMSLEDTKELIDFGAALEPLPDQVSGYINDQGQPLFRQGATITPKVLTIIANEKPDMHQDMVEIVTTRSQHDPWKSLPEQTGKIPSVWIRNVLISNKMFPFSVDPSPVKAVIPLEKNGTLCHNPEDKSEFWRRMECKYGELRGKGKYTPQTLLKRINYGRALSLQITPPS